MYFGDRRRCPNPQLVEIRAAALSLSLILLAFAFTFAASPSSAEDGLITIPDETPAPLKRKQLHKAQPGPWGNLEYFVMDLRPPESLVDRLMWPNERTEWHFPGMSREQAKENLLAIGFTEEDLAWAADSSRSNSAETKTTLYPPHDWLENLTADRRMRIAGLLSPWRENITYKDAIIVRNHKPEAWFSGKGISAETTRLAAKCCYPRGERIVFSDIPLLMDRIKSPQEKRDFTRLLSKQSTLVLRMRLGEGTDVEQVSEYWSAGYKRKDVLSIFDSVTENDEVEMLDVAHLLPPLPRKLLYTYPSPEEGAAGAFPDCHWTSLNFFNYSPQKKFLKSEPFFTELKENFKEVERPLQFGDVLVIWSNDTKKLLHSAVYIADNIVFTKNGNNPARPWILSTFDEMISTYLVEGELKIRFFRRN